MPDFRRLLAVENKIELYRKEVYSQFFLFA